MLLIQTIALLCQIHGATVEYHQRCHIKYLTCVEDKYNSYVKRTHSENRLPTGDYEDTFLKQCIKEKAQ